jgi:hypothetical protein
MPASEPLKCPYRCLEWPKAKWVLPARQTRQNSALPVWATNLGHLLQNWFAARRSNRSYVYGCLVPASRSLT